MMACDCLREAERIINEAKAGEFHDYKNEKYVCGKVALVSLLIEANLLELKNAVVNGEYDEVADEEDKAKMREGLPEKMLEIFGL